METIKVEVIKNGNVNIPNIESGAKKERDFSSSINVENSFSSKKEYDIYFAGPLFTAAEIEFNLKLYKKLTDHGFKVFLPQNECAGKTDLKTIFETCRNGIDISKIVLANMDQPDADSGTCFEAGYAYGKNTPIIAYRTDFRKSGDTGGFNLMLFYSALIVVEEPKEYISKIIEACNKYIKIEAKGRYDGKYPQLKINIPD